MATIALEEIVDRARASVIDAAAMRDRYRAVLLGVAAGNALGLSVEGEPHSSIRKLWPNGVAEIDPEEARRDWDDDLAQTYELAEALLRTEELNPDYFAQQLVRWGRESGRGMGQLMRDSLQELASGRPALDAARVAWERSGWSTAGNGAVTRCAPVALRYRSSGAALVRNARTSALVTHFDARCEWSTVIVAVVLAVALAGEIPDLDGLAAAAEEVGGTQRDAAAREQVAEAIRGSRRAALERLELDDPMDMGYTLKAMQVALWCAQHPGGFEHVVCDVVNAGGDTDSNGAVAGAVMGACRGSDGIPRRWMERIARTDRLGAAADALFDASGAA